MAILADMDGFNQFKMRPGMFSTAMYVRANWRMKAKVLCLVVFVADFFTSARLRSVELRVEVLSIGRYYWLWRLH